MTTKTRILIIEDNEQNMYMLTYLLEANQYEVFQSFTGVDGLKKAKLLIPEVILLDIQLPGTDGYRIAQELRKEKSLQRTTIIAVTSFAMIGDQEKSIEAGADGYIEKPIDPETFILRMESFIADKKSKRRNPK